MAFAFVGCGSGEADLSKQDENALKNPSKTIPPEAIEGMKNSGEAVKKQQEANKAAGIDDRGIPIQKSGGN